MNLKSTKSQRIQFLNSKFINRILGVGWGGGRLCLNWFDRKYYSLIVILLSCKL